MLNALRGAVRFLDQKIGWNRVGIALSIAIITVAAVVLYRMLQDISGEEVIEAFRAKPIFDVVLAFLFVAAGYFTLTFYDLFALRTIGKDHVPYRVAALAGFTSYSVGHNVGLTALSGGAVRNSVLFRGVKVHAGAMVEGCLLLDNCDIGRRARVRRAILDKNVRVPADACIGYDLEHDRRYHHVTDSGIVVVEGNRSSVEVSTLVV